MTGPQRSERAKQISDAMASLAGNPNFAAFIEVMREQREAAIQDACSDAVVSNERSSIAAIGEIRVYTSIISTYEEFKDRPANDESAER